MVEYLSDAPSFQIMLMVAINIVYTIYLGAVKPMATRASNRMEMMNDWFAFNLTVMFMLFTDWVVDQESQYKLGYLMLGLMAVNALINICVIWFDLLRRLKLLARKLIARAKEMRKQKAGMEFVRDSFKAWIQAAKGQV